MITKTNDTDQPLLIRGFKLQKLQWLLLQPGQSVDVDLYVVTQPVKVVAGNPQEVADTANSFERVFFDSTSQQIWMCSGAFGEPTLVELKGVIRL